MITFRDSEFDYRGTYTYNDVEVIEKFILLYADCKNKQIERYSIDLKIKTPVKTIKISSSGKYEKKINEFIDIEKDYNEISLRTFKSRMNKYMECLNNNGYFDYAQYRFFINGDVMLLKNKTIYFNINECELITYKYTYDDILHGNNTIYANTHENGLAGMIIKNLKPRYICFTEDKDIFPYLLYQIFGKKIIMFEN